MPVYKRENTCQPALIGTGLLLAISQTRFLLTVGHVLDEMLKCSSAVPFYNHLLPVVGEPTRTRTPGTITPAKDCFDVGFIRLGGPWDSSELSAFLGLAEVTISLALFPREAFSIIGYPATKQRHSCPDTNLLRSCAYPLATIGRPASSYETLGYEPKINLLLGFDKQKVWGEGGLQTAPDPYGMSGGGVWYFGKRLAEASTPPRLGGIGIGWLRKDKVLVATRMDQYSRSDHQQIP